MDIAQSILKRTGITAALPKVARDWCVSKSRYGWWVTYTFSDGSTIRLEDRT